MNYNIIISLSILMLLLSGCVTSAQQQTHNQYQSAATQERLAWQSAQSRSDVKCGSYNDENPLPRAKSMEVIKCYVELARESVLPNAINPTKADAYLVSLQEVSLDYKNGKIDRDEANIRQQKLWNNYSQSIDGQYSSDMARAYQSDVISAQQRQQAMQSMGSALIEASEPAPNVQSTPTMTTCEKFGTGIQCRQW